MARVILGSNLSRFAGGVPELEVEAKNIQQLLRQLGERFPALKPRLEKGLAVAVDGQIYQDALLQPLPADSEIHLLPRIAGG